MSATNDQPAGRAVLWDLDGTLIDSMGYHWQAWRDSLAPSGIDLSYERFSHSSGLRNNEVIRLFFGPDMPLAAGQRIGAAKELRYQELVRTRGLALLPGVEHWLKQIKAAGWRQAMASAAPRANIEVVTEVLDLARYFEAIVSADDVQRGKPDPQIFLLAAQRLGVRPEHCLVIEDAPAGVEGARRAGMRSIGVLATCSQLEADIVVSSLEDLPFERLEQLFSVLPITPS